MFWQDVIKLNIQKYLKYEIFADNEQYERVSRDLKRSIPNAHSIKIYMIMNQTQWQKFNYGINQDKDNGKEEDLKYLWYSSQQKLKNQKQIY